MRRLGLWAVLSLTILGCDRRETSPNPASPTPTAPATLSGISITGAAPLKGRGQTLQLHAVGSYSDGSSRDQTSDVIWASSNSSVATVTGTGLVTSAGFGGADIAASVGQLEARTSITVVPVTIEFAALSQGACGSATFQKNGDAFYSKPGCTLGGGRGFNVAAINSLTGELLEPVQNFDTWLEGSTAARAMISMLQRQPQGTVLLIAVGDEAGLTEGRTAGCPRDPQAGTTCCRPLGGDIEGLRVALEGLGAARIRRYCYWNSYALIAIKGIGSVSENLEPTSQAIARYAIQLQ